MEGPAELAGGERIDRLLAGEQPAAGQHHPALAPGPPPGAQQIEQGSRQHGIAVLAPLALLDPDHLALAIDVGEFERDHLRGAQPGAVGDRQRRLVLEAPGLELWAASNRRAISSGLSTTGNLRGSRTPVIPTAASSRPSVTPNKKRKPETAVFMLVAEAPADLMCGW